MLIGAIGGASAATYEVTVTNVTRGQVITPPFVATHNAQVSLFQLGQPAIGPLIPLAEDGDGSALVAAAGASANVSDVTTGSAPIPPGDHATLMIDSAEGFPYLTVATMLATTNDAFAAVHSMPLPSAGGSSMHYATVYDAGTESNTEACATIPGPPCANGGVRDTTEAEGYVHVHSGIHGIGDLAPETYDWRNPGVIVSVRMVQ